MKRAIAGVLAIVLTAASPPSSGSNGGSHPAPPASHPAPPPSHPAPPPSHPAPPPSHPAPPPSHPAPPPSHPAPPPSHPAPGATPGFNLHNDLRTPPPSRPVGPPSLSHPAGPAPLHPPVRRPPPRPVPPGGWHGHPVYPPHYGGQPPSWGWNHGVVWYPAPLYWGGGFWGPYAFGVTYAWFGYYTYGDSQYPSYQVQAGTPGATLLQAYDLTQTACGPPGLVVIWGPDDSVICATPNQYVAAGLYQMDPSTLTLESLTPGDAPPQ